MCGVEGGAGKGSVFRGLKNDNNLQGLTHDSRVLGHVIVCTIVYVISCYFYSCFSHFVL